MTSRTASTIGLIAVTFIQYAAVHAAESSSDEFPAARPNVLFIVADDLRPELGCYGAKQVKSPHIDALAKQGITFERAYCQYPQCGPSRACVLSGVRPTERLFRENGDSRVSAVPGRIMTLPGAFKRAGYHTISNGKVFHHMDDTAELSWSEKPYDLVWECRETFDPESKKYIHKNGRGPFFEAPDVPYGTYVDDRVCEKSICDLRRLKEMEQPFFLAVGFIRPHLPFYAPKKYWDLYKRDEIQVADNCFMPENAPASLKLCPEMQSYHSHNIEYNSLAWHKTARHGYYACVSYVDDLVGRVLATLDELELRENTIVILWGDHGWNLGEHNLWSKKNLVHNSMHAPLILSVPGFEKNIRTEGIVEFVDMYPTLCELAGLEIPQHVEGDSMVPLLRDPKRSWKKAAFVREAASKGTTVVTRDFCYTEYYRAGTRMLFDRRKDPDENVNVAENPEYAETVKELRKMLQGGWKHARPGIRGRGEFAGLRFPHSGVVRRDMVFRSFPQTCLYVETPTEWSSFGRPFPYLYRVLEPEADRATARQSNRPDILFEDFEDETYGNWRAEGTAFTKPTVPARFDHPQPILGYQGTSLADSATGDPKRHQWDAPQGKLISKPLSINRPYIRFLIGGGNHPGRTCVNLLVDDRVVRTATGRNSEELLPRTWEVREFAGKQGVIEIVDAHPGGWGHIMVDDIVLTDEGGDALKTEPPLGMRSAVVLGGLGAGSVELRADGSLRDWNIFNNHPMNRTHFGRKVQLEEALFGLRVAGDGVPPRAWALRTHAPGDLPSIEQIEYSGSFPVSRLRVSDKELPIEVNLYAYSEFHIGNAKASATPAAIFSFQLHNPSDKKLQTSLLFHLPNHIEGEFAGQHSLVLTRDGEDSISGSMAVQVAGGERVSCGSGAGLADVWKPFAGTGEFVSGKRGRESFVQSTRRAVPANDSRPLFPASGGITAAVSLKPGETRTVTFALGWYFPHKPYWKGKAYGEEHDIIGNHYTTLYRSAEDVVGKALNRLPATLAAARHWHELCFDNDLPVWLQDSMVNSPHTMFLTGIWTQDGRWRQWESFSCAGLDPIHVQLYRSQTFAYFFPELLKSLLEGFVKHQRADGYIVHRWGERGGFEVAEYRRQTCGLFLINVYQYYRATGDREFLEHVWPASKKATEWAIRQSGSLKLPTKLQSTYEIKYNYQDGAAYNSFIYLAGLSIAREMARLNGDKEFADRMQGLLDEARGLVDARFWTGEFYRAWWNANGNHPDAIQSDTLYGQLWASLLDLGFLAPPQKLKAQLASEKRLTNTPFGLQVCVGRDPKPYLWDETIWPAASMTWAALMIYLDGDVDEALAMAKKSYDNYATRVRDPWDIKDVYAKDDGYPWCNSHYGRQNIFWSIPLALSGQQYDAAGKTLSFDPKAGAPASLPWFFPGANGIVRRLDRGTYQVTVLSGELKLAQLRIADTPPVRDVALEVGQSLTVHAR